LRKIETNESLIIVSVTITYDHGKLAFCYKNHAATMNPPESPAPRNPGGRPKGDEPTKVVRLPVSLADRARALLKSDNLREWPQVQASGTQFFVPPTHLRRVELPLFSTRVRAGFPSPADDHVEKRLDLNELCIAHPEATFFVRVSGDSMTRAGLSDNDILVVDRALDAQPGMIVVAAINNEVTVKRLARRRGRFYLDPESDNPSYQPIELKEGLDCVIWGVVRHVVRKL